MAATSETPVQSEHRPEGDERFFLIASAVMVTLIIAGFLTLYLRGISTFAAPWPVHVHAVAFMAWVGFFMLQVTLATTGRVHLHKRLGWIGAVLMPVLLILGALINHVSNVRLVEHYLSDVVWLESAPPSRQYSPDKFLPVLQAGSWVDALP